MIEITPKQLTYISISLAIIVTITTLGIIIFPNFFSKIDDKLALKKKHSHNKLKIAYFINYAISPLTVCIFYFFIGGILLLNNHFKIFGIGVSSIIFVSTLFRCLKRITQRPRPKQAMIKFKDYSFPSGHTAAGFVFFLSFALTITQIFRPVYYDRLFIVAILFSFIIARSRRYLHVHYISDVIIGSLLGIGCFIFSYLLFLYFGDAILQTVEHVFFSLY